MFLQIVDIKRPQYRVCHITICSHEKKRKKKLKKRNKKAIVSLYHLWRIIHSKNSQDEKTCQENYINYDTQERVSQS